MMMEELIMLTMVMIMKNGDNYDDDDDDAVETLTLAHRWQHRHHKHWPPQCQARRTSLGGWL